jgi:hypothetical protein
MAGVLDAINGHSIEELHGSLDSAIRWCSWRLAQSTNPEMLRSLELRPWSLAATRKEVVGSVVSNRCPLARSVPFNPSLDADLRLEHPKQSTQRPSCMQSVNPRGPLHGGRLLMYVPDTTCLIGLAAAETHGYFDFADAPPWDTWIAWIEETNSGSSRPTLKYLVSLVAREHLQLAQSGVDVSPTCCIRWIDEEPCVLREQLVANGTL